MRKLILLILGMILLISFASAGTFIEPLDLKTLFVDYFLGSMELFIFGFVIVFSYVCATYQMSNRLYLILLAISIILFAILLELNEIYLLVVAIIGIIVFRTIPKIIQ